MAASRTPPYCTRQQAQKTDTRIDAERKQKESRKKAERKQKESRKTKRWSKDAHPPVAQVTTGRKTCSTPGSRSRQGQSWRPFSRATRRGAARALVASMPK